MIAAPQCTETITAGNVIDWRSHRSARVCQSKLAAEACSCDDAVDRAYYINITLAEILKAEPAHRTTFRLPQLQVTDCKSLYDAICAQNPRTLEKRTMVDIRSIQEFANEKSIRWTPTELMWADGLTKCSKALLLEFAAWLKQPYVKLTDKATRSAAFA